MKKLLVSAAVSCALLMLPDVAAAKSVFGGIVFTDFYLRSLDSEASETMESVSLTRVEVPNITRLRGRWTNEDDVEMYIELGIGGSSGSTGVNVRHAFGKWDFSTTGQLMAGHTSSPFSPLFPSQAIGNNNEESHNVGKGYGEVSSGRAPQVRYTYKFLNTRGAFAIALLDSNRDDEIDIEINGIKSSKLPRIDIGMAYQAYNWQIFPSAFYQRRDYDGSDFPGGARVDDDSVTSWGASLGFRGGRGPWVLSAELNVGENMRNANLGIGSSVAALSGGAFISTNAAGELRLEDTTNRSWWFDAGYKFTHNEWRGVVHMIAGQMTSEREDGGFEQEFEGQMIGISVPTDLPWIAKGLRFRPEVFVYENDNGGNDIVAAKKGTEIIGGIQLQYTF